MKFLITGCTGFIGSRLTKSFLQNGYSVRGLVMSDEVGKATDLVQLGMEQWVGDVLYPDTLLRIEEGIDVVYHFVGKHSSSITRMQETYVEGTRNLLDQLKHNTSCKFIVSSNGAVYGGYGDMILNEFVQPTPFHPFGLITLEMEKVINEYNQTYHIPTIILRISEIYGPHNYNFVRQYCRNPQLIGDGSNYVSKIHIDDVVAVLIIAWKRLKPGTIYNLTDDLPVYQRDILDEIRKYMDIEQIKWIAPDELPERIRLGIHGLRTLSIRMSNNKIKQDCALQLKYPTYLEGIKYLVNEMQLTF